MTTVFIISLVYVGIWAVLWLADEIRYRKDRKRNEDQD
jgi:hypothetical protein